MHYNIEVCYFYIYCNAISEKERKTDKNQNIEKHKKGHKLDSNQLLIELIIIKISLNIIFII
jgi:hypothetical protein